MISQTASDPIFSIRLIYNEDKDGKLEREEISIENVGAPTYNISAEYNNYISLSSINKKLIWRIPLYSYFGGLDVDGNRNIHIRQTASNSKYIGALYEFVFDIGKKNLENKEWEKLYYVDFLTIVMIEYTTRYGEQKKEYFNGSRKIDAKDYEMITRHKVPPKIFVLGKDSPKDLLAKMDHERI
jgi:hypothetical protein